MYFSPLLEQFFSDKIWDYIYIWRKNMVKRYKITLNICYFFPSIPLPIDARVSTLFCDYTTLTIP